MSQETEHIDDLIGKYLAGEAAQDEIQFVELWARESEDNKKYLEQCKVIFDKTLQVKQLQEFDTDAAWVKMKSRLHDSQKFLIGSAAEKSRKNFYWMAAASVVVVLGIAFFAYRLTSPASIAPAAVVTETDTKADTLPDGSGVFLNKKTELTYSYDNSKKSHLVKLKGEAYFKIKHEENKTFIIDAAGAYIKDIGTAFNVKAYPDSGTIEVYVEEGSVMFYTNNDSGVYLSANGKGIYDKATKTFAIEKAGENVLAYKTRFFNFSNTDLQSITLALNNVYDKKIILDKTLHNCHLTVSFNDEDIDEIAAIIAETLGLVVTKSANEIRLEGPGCEN